MSQTSTGTKQQKSGGNGMRVDMKLEVHVIPVADVERSKQFYERLGWRFDADLAPTKDVRIVQFTPPGSGCSVIFGKGIIVGSPGSAEGTLVVSDIEAAREELVGRGVDASEVWHGASFPPEARLSGLDDNTWIVQEVTTRLPGRA
jgi:catechol 2,3-dioxygenase-like lactoylglutathione lyase family enzyme